MSIRKLERTDWQPFFDQLSAHLRGRAVDVEVPSPTLGAQVEARAVPLVGLSCDPRSRALDVALEGHDHRIRDPQEVYVDETSQGLQSLEVVGADGAKEILQFKPTLRLPAVTS